jgi:hypothetical protein
MPTKLHVHTDVAAMVEIDFVLEFPWDIVC